MDPFGKTFLNNISLNVTGYMEISMDSFSTEFLIIVSKLMLQDTWKFPWTI